MKVVDEWPNGFHKSLLLKRTSSLSHMHSDRVWDFYERCIFKTSFQLPPAWHEIVGLVGLYMGFCWLKRLLGLKLTSVYCFWVLYIPHTSIQMRMKLQFDKVWPNSPANVAKFDFLLSSPSVYKLAYEYVIHEPIHLLRLRWELTD